MKSMPQDWEKIYKEAVYVVFFEIQEIRFKIGEDSNEIDKILSQSNAESFAFLTAYNPLSRQLSETENNRRQIELIKFLRAENYQFLQGYGTNEDESWKREESLFVLKISEENAIQFARKFQQHAIVFGEKYKPAKLIWCS